MATRPPAVRIDDLADPQFPPHIAEMLGAIAPIAAEIRLEPEPLLAQACVATGLSDFGDDAFRERLDVLCRALREEAGLSPMGKVSSQSQLVKLLSNRLLIEDLVARHPEIRDVEIAQPIIIAGLPRTGTTHLHNLIAADPAMRSLPYWESLEPVLPASEQPAPGEPDPRLARTAQGLAFLDETVPYFKRMHEMTVDHVHEEIHLLAIDFSTMLFETMAVMPTWRDYYKAHDQTPSYRYLRKVLQVLQWQRGGDRWILKSPQHLEQFGPLTTVFPDATFVITHRDPVSITASLATMISYTARTSTERVDPPKIGRYWAGRIKDKLRACMRDRHVLPADRSIDVRFDEFMADDVAMVERIYKLANQPFTRDVRDAMDAFMLEHPRGLHGGVIYDLEGDFGIDPAERRAAMRDYSQQFDVADEYPA